MKNLCISILLLIVCGTISAQEHVVLDTTQYLCKYNYTFCQDSTSKNSVRSQIMVLQVGKRISKFTSEANFIRDSLVFMYKDEDMAVAVPKILPQISGQRNHPFAKFYIYKNYPQKRECTFVGMVNTKVDMEYTQQPVFNWKIVANADSVVAGYPCKKAVTSFAGRQYVAWFAPTLPISDGPYKFNGLPGLIVCLHDTRGEHRFELLTLSKARFIQPLYMAKGRDLIKGSPEMYVKGLNTYNAEFLKSFQRGEKGAFDDETTARAINNLKSSNNFIEKF
jgi:GLPGLI family protein